MSCAALILSLGGAVAAAQDPETMAISGVTVIDTINGRAVPNSTVTIRDGVITSVTAGGASPTGARRVDGRGKFLIPGLWDMHAHHQMTGDASLPLFVANGVTGTRDMGADLDFILPLRQRTASGQILGPRIIAAGPMLDDRPPDWPYRITVRTGDEARNAVRMLKERGVDLIKVHDRTPPEAYQAIADEARRQGLPFAGHLPRGITIEAAAAAGQRSIEHLAGLRMVNQCSGGQTYSAEKCRPFFEWLAKSGLWQTPTLVNWRKMFTLGTPEGDAEQDHLAYASPGLLEFLALNQKDVECQCPRRSRSRRGCGHGRRGRCRHAEGRRRDSGRMRWDGRRVLSSRRADAHGQGWHVGGCSAADRHDQSGAIAWAREGARYGRGWQASRPRAARREPAR